MITEEKRRKIRNAMNEIRHEEWFSSTPFKGLRGSEVGGVKTRNRVCADMTERHATYIGLIDPRTMSDILDYIETLETILGDIGDSTNGYCN